MKWITAERMQEIKQYLSIKEFNKIFQLLAPYVWKYKKSYAVMVLLLLTGIGVTLIFAWFMGNVIDAAISGDFERLSNLIVIGLLISGYRIISNFIWIYVETTSMNNIKKDLNQDLYKHILTLSPHDLNRAHSGEWMSHFTNDIQSVNAVVGRGLLNLIQFPIMITAALIYLMSISWKLSLITLSVAPIALVAGGVFGLLLKNNGAKIHETISELTKKLNDTFHGMTVIRSFTLENLFNTQYRKQTEDLYKLELKEAKIQGTFFAGGQAIASLTFLISLLMGAYFVGQGAITAGMLLTFVNLVNLLVTPLTGFAGQWAGYQRSITALERVVKVFDQSKTTDELPYKKDTIQLKEDIKIEKVDFSYEKNNRLFQDLSLTLPAGKVSAFVGPSGAGKSTLFQLLMRFYDVQKGAIKIEGRSISDWDLAELRSAISYVPQDTFLFSGTVAENLTLGAVDIPYEKMVQAAKDANIHDFIITLPERYQTELGERGIRLSGGQRQRIAIARALLKDAPILLLDEATSALDSETEMLVKTALQRLMEGRTTIMIAHRLSTIRHADVIFVFKEGQLVQSGMHQDLKNEGLYKELIEADLFTRRNHSEKHVI
ncbi:ABC transporter ATP-binding protein [Jeotgalibacillus aurantiacus]|uniref:ABC transporter ATP-binding protein n=1 Tax=Jeotgalibacillus aurantiacus TaxID=2763266 RepID=UPI001D0AAC7E|nr:ABC transporter ATP-binding protein [Jeotgalibacillus aurantiacus]